MNNWSIKAAKKQQWKIFIKGSAVLGWQGKHTKQQQTLHPSYCNQTLDYMPQQIFPNNGKRPKNKYNKWLYFWAPYTRADVSTTPTDGCSSQKQKRAHCLQAAQQYHLLHVVSLLIKLCWQEFSPLFDVQRAPTSFQLFCFQKLKHEECLGFLPWLWQASYQCSLQAHAPGDPSWWLYPSVSGPAGSAHHVWAEHKHRQDPKDCISAKERQGHLTRGHCRQELNALWEMVWSSGSKELPYMSICQHTAAPQKYHRASHLCRGTFDLNGILEHCSLKLYDCTDLKYAKDLGGQIQVKQHKPSHRPEAFHSSSDYHHKHSTTVCLKTLPLTLELNKYFNMSVNTI